jgi:hypothetical protein
MPNLHDFACRDFKIAERRPGPWGCLWPAAWNGWCTTSAQHRRGPRRRAPPAARPRVLKVLEQNGIVVDMIAGTARGD